MKDAENVLCTLHHPMMISVMTVSSICAFSVFISPTQRMGSRAFNSSVMPAASIMRGSMASIRSRAARSISNRCGYSFSLKIKLL